ncbi:major facilitator superfamily domain-containing protein [Mrakia frigida]|uniref:major facilitator superfamily domain-containing protein n=1 Tax=Mrakia frigida TaxID=29902 RepID=UPI003FCC03DA
MDEKKDPSPSVAGDNDEPAALEKGKVDREVEDGPDSTEREFDPASAAEDAKITFPDGGVRAWFVVAGALHMTFATFGFTNAWGVFQAYYETDLLSTSNPSSIAWIGSLQYCLIFLPAVIMGRLFDTGTFIVPYTISALTYTVSVILIAQCKEYYQFVLCQGVLLGLSAGVMFGPTLAIVSHWFHKKRAMAYGVVACGSSIGGTIFPIMVRKLIPIIGFQWTIRACALIVLYCVTFGWCTLRPRLEPKNVAGGLFNFAAFRRPAFSLYVLGCFLVMSGLYTPLTYLDVAGARIGLGEFSSYLVAIANAFSLVGRLVPGFYADKVGPVNILIPFSAISGILIFAWPYCVSKASLIVFSALMGIATGAFVSLFSPGVAQLGETHDIGRRMGMLTTCLAAAALIGPPISGAILSKTESFLSVASFAGTVVLAGTVVMLGARFALLKRWWGKM